MILWSFFVGEVVYFIGCGCRFGDVIGFMVSVVFYFGFAVLCIDCGGLII